MDKHKDRGITQMDKHRCKEITQMDKHRGKEITQMDKHKDRGITQMTNIKIEEVCNKFVQNPLKDVDSRVLTRMLRKDGQ